MTNNVYTLQEEKTIVYYLIDNNITANLQGNALWKRMEQEGVLNRTWQSMRTHFRTAIINALHLYDLSEYNRNMILHGFGRNSRSKTNQLARPAPPKKPIPFSSDSDSDTTICVAAQAKRPRRESGSNASLDLLTCNTTSNKRTVNANNNDNNQPRTSVSAAKTNRDIRSYLISMDDTNIETPKTSNPKAKVHKIRKPKRNDTVIIIDSDDDEPIKQEVTEQQVEQNEKTESFRLEEDTELIKFFKKHTGYLTDVRNNFAYVAFNYDTPTSFRTPNELRIRFVDHIMPKLYTYNCLTYEEMVTFYDRTDIDVPVELQQIISETVAEQKKNKHVAAPKVTVDVSTQAEQRSGEDNMISTDGSDIDVEIILDQLAAQDQPNPPDARPAADVARKQKMVDASTQVSQGNADKIRSSTLVDASTQVQPPAREDKVCNTERLGQVNASTQTQQQRMCNTDVVAQHVEFVTDNMLHIFLPEHDERRPLQDLQNIYNKYGKSQKSPHTARQNKYRVLNDKRYVDIAADLSVQPIVIDKCEAEMSRLTAELKRLEGTLCKLRGYEAKEAVCANKENQNAESNLAGKNANCTIVSDMSNNTSIISCTVESDGDADVNKSDNAGTRGSQTANQPELMFDIFQTELNKKHVSTQMNASVSDEQQMDSSNATQDGDQEENSTVIAIQQDIEFSTRQLCQPVEVILTSDDSDNTELPADSAACQMEPLNLSTNSHGSEENENVLSTNSDKFYSAVSQN